MQKTLVVIDILSFQFQRTLKTETMTGGLIFFAVYMYVNKVIDSGRKRLNQLHSVISNTSITLSARRMLLLSVVRPSLEYRNES